MLNGMSTIKMIEISKSKIWPKIGWYDGSDDRQRFVTELQQFKCNEYGTKWCSIKQLNNIPELNAD